MKIFDINTPKVTQKMAGYMANRVRTWAEAKQLYEMETEGTGPTTNNDSSPGPTPSRQERMGRRRR